MRDLEIRGAGNILGTQQSGQIAAVGYELYASFGSRTPYGRRNRTTRSRERHVAIACRCRRSARLLVLRPEKIDVDRKFSRIESLEQLKKWRGKLSRRFGPIPEPGAAGRN